MPPKPRTPKPSAPSRPATVLDLNAARTQRFAAFAARRAQAGHGDSHTLSIVFGPGDPVIAHLGPELALETFAPLLEMEIDLPRLIVTLMSVDTSGDDNEAAGEAVIGALVNNPDLPRELVEAAKQVLRNLLGSTGYDAYVSQSPSPQDLATLGGGLLGWYGLDLGSFLSFLQPSTDGTTSTPTSAATTPA